MECDINQLQYNFEWDPVKAETNYRKHGVSFERAIEVFRDPLALTIADTEHSDILDERWITLGQIYGKYYLVVIHTEKNIESNKVSMRIISARKATRSEVNQYNLR